MISFNMSYSSLQIYKESERTFYYAYIKKISPPDETISVYGTAGNVLHKNLEVFSQTNNKGDFQQEWNDKGLNNDKGFNEQPLSLPIYKKCVEFGYSKIEAFQKMGYKIKAEEKFEFYYQPGIMIKGFVDIVAFKDDRILLIDWKTDSSADKLKHKEQRLFYSWLYWKKYNKIPNKCIWYYLKLKKDYSDSFTLKEIKEYEQYIYNLIEEIKQKGEDINNYEIGDISSPFNAYKSLMTKNDEGAKKVEADFGAPPRSPTSPASSSLTIIIENAELKLSGDALTDELKDFFMGEFSYEKKQAFFIKKSAGKKGYKDDGFRRFFHYNKNTLPIGFLNRLKLILNNLNINFTVIDKRVTLKKYTMPDKLYNIELRGYQKEAVDFVMKNKITFLEIATSGGKTAIAAEIIRQNKGLTLFVVDRGVLLNQTMREFKNFFQEEIGSITEGEINLKKINVSTIQTINKILDRKENKKLAESNLHLRKILANIKTLITDEGHTVAAKSFIKMSKYVLNADIRLGLSGTYERPDGDSMMIESVVGRPIFQISADSLIKQNYIMKPKIWFFKLTNSLTMNLPMGSKYHDYYNTYIIENKRRNQHIINMVNKLSDKKILIIISKIRHGELLNSQLKDSVFIHGKVDSETREEWLDEIRNDNRKIIIGTDSIVGKGLDIPVLDVLINATGNLSSIITIQSLGRILRKAKDKEPPIYIDFYDEGKYLKEHAEERIRVLRQQKHEVNIFKQK